MSSTIVGLQDANTELNLINPVMRPEDIRNGDPVSCNLLFESKVIQLQLWSYCPFGFEVLLKDDLSLEVGKILVFELCLGKTKFQCAGSVVFHRTIQNDRKLAGIRIHYNPTNSESHTSERRTSTRWNCPEHLLPSGTTPNPIRFNDFVLFRVVDASAKGLKLSTSLRNKMLCVGQVLEVSISVPMIGQLTSSLKINRVAVEEIYGKQQLILGVSFVKTDEILLSTLSEYLLTFAEKCSVSSLRESGFPARFVSTAYDFTYVKSQKDYEDVLDLRYECYMKSGKIGGAVTRDFMRDEYDSRARILVIKYQGKIVASVRGMFHDAGDVTSHERYLSYPPDFPGQKDCLELSRLCVRDDHQSAGLANELTKHFILLAVKSNRRYCYFSVTDSFKSHWIDLGFSETGTTYVHEQLGGLQHHLMICDAKQAILGKNTKVNAWLNSYEHLYDYCVEYGLIEPTIIDVTRSTLLRIFKPILK